MSIKSRLFTLCDPLAEAMSDKDRIDAFVKAGLDAVAEIERLTKIEAAAKALLDFFVIPAMSCAAAPASAHSTRRPSHDRSVVSLKLGLVHLRCALGDESARFCEVVRAATEMQGPIGDGGGSHGRIARTSIDGLEGPIC